MLFLLLFLRIGIRLNAGTRRVDCNVTCWWPKHSSGVVRRLVSDNPSFYFTMSMESEDYYSSLKLYHETANHKICSTRFDSFVPLPYFSWAEYDIQHKPLPYQTLIKAGLFVARNCNSRSGRELLVKQLMQRMPVNSASGCLRNYAWDGRNKSDLMSRHVLYFAFENSIVDDYVTEKLWGAFSSGAIPVYYGAPNIKDHIPPGSAVIVNDYPTVDLLVSELMLILNDENHFNFYHAWRYQPLPLSFVSKYNFTHTHSECRLCQKLNYVASMSHDRTQL